MVIATGHGGLGLIPNWQFVDANPPNQHVNPFVTYPDGITEVTPQPWGTKSWMEQTPADLKGPGLGLFEFFDSWGWRNRKYLVIGGGALMVLGVASLLR